MSILLSLVVAASSFLDRPPAPASPAPPAVRIVTASPGPGKGAQTPPDGTPEATLDASAALAQGDRHFSRRSIGAIDGVADPREVDEAIASYRLALAASPDDIVILAKLMRALHFKGAYTGATHEEKKTIFDEGKNLGQSTVDRLEEEARRARGKTRVEALRLVKGAPSLYLWTAGHWGEWGLVRGKFAAARTGVAGKLRDLSQAVIDLDPRFEDAAGYRLLGRLHAVAPKIIFFTGWVSHDKGVELLRQASQIAPNHVVTMYFLAEAILQHEAKNRDEAVRLLERAALAPPRPDTVLEDLHYSRLAQKKLDEMRGAP